MNLYRVSQDENSGYDTYSDDDFPLKAPIEQ